MLDVPKGALWLPGVGVSGTDERAAANAVNAYDSGLVLGQNRETGEWIVFLRHGPHNGEPFPVLGLGTRLPAADEITKKLYACDVRRHGERLFRDIYKRQEAQLAEHHAAINDKTGVFAEALEHGFRKMGAHPSPRVFLPAGVKSVPREGR